MLARRLGCEPHCALMPASRMTFAHFAASVLNCAAHSSGELPTGSRPSVAIRSFMSGSAMVLTISLWSSAMISLGVRAGTITANHASPSMSGYPASAIVGTSGSACKGHSVIQGWIDDDGVRNHEHGIAIRRCLCPLTHSDIAASTANVFDIELFSEMFGQLLCDEASEYVGRTAGRERNDHTHRPCRIGLRPRNARHGRQRDGGRVARCRNCLRGSFILNLPL